MWTMASVRWALSTGIADRGLADELGILLAYLRQPAVPRRSRKDYATMAVALVRLPRPY
jgi:hypothetical protein